MSPLDEKPFRSEGESDATFVRMSHPEVRAHVAPLPDRSGELTKADFATTFLVSWRPVPEPPARWIELLRTAPFGTQTVRARNLHWDGHNFSVELPSESEIEEFAAEMEGWVEFANAEYRRRDHAAAEEALAEARKRAETLENRLRRR